MTSVVESRFASRLRAARRFRGLTLADVARETGLQLGIVSKIELGQRGVRLGEAAALADAVGFTLAALLADEPLTATVPVTA